MRDARSNDIWRKLFKRQDRKILGLNVQYTGIPELGDGMLAFPFPINLICGENGVGKSAAMWTLVKAFDLDGSLDGVHKIGRPKGAGGQIQSATISINDNNGGNTAPLRDALDALSQAGEAITIALIDPGLQIPHFLSTLRRDTNPQDLVEGVAPRELEEKDLKMVNELTGKDYSKIQIYEIEDYAELPVFPYFAATYGGSTYNSVSMGLGEFSLLYLYWKLSGLPKNSVILLEEPESFAAPRSQRVLIDYLAYLCDKEGHFVVMSSHSGTIAERVPNSAIQLCTRAGKAVAFTPDPSPKLLVDRLALYLRRRFVALVEDESAKSFCRAFVELVDSRVSADLDILVSGSESQIAAALKSIRPDTTERLQLVGVFDGDQLEKLPKDLLWPAICLPGKRNPDTDIRDIARKADQSVLAQALKLEQETLTLALGGLEGLDDHDWITRLCATIDVTRSQLFSRLMPIWLEQNPIECREFQSRLRVALKLQ